MKQTPAHDRYTPNLLALIPKQSRRVVEVGSSSGGLARAFKDLTANCHYTGIELESEYAELSKRYCNRVLHANVEELDESIFDSLFASDCWVFGDSLGHLQDPWRLLRRIRSKIDTQTSVVACIPNAQHWSLQPRLNCGLFRN